MSTPTSRKSKKGSVSGTPARSRASHPASSSPSAARRTPPNGTPRGSQAGRGNAEMSSPMFVGSDVPSISSVSQRARQSDVSSPRDAPSTADGGSTPRGPARIPGGECLVEILSAFLTAAQDHRPFTMLQAQVPVDLLLPINDRAMPQLAAVACLSALRDLGLPEHRASTTQDGVTSTPKSLTPPLLEGNESSWMRMEFLLQRPIIPSRTLIQRPPRQTSWLGNLHE